VDRSLKEMLHTSVDGLKWNHLVPSMNNWVTDGTNLLSGSDYIQAIKVRGNLLETRMRGARGQRDGDIRCEAGCNARETLSHISQSCARTQPLCTKLHDALLDFMEKCYQEEQPGICERASDPRALVSDVLTLLSPRTTELR